MGSTASQAAAVQRLLRGSAHAVLRGELLRAKDARFELGRTITMPVPVLHSAHGARASGVKPQKLGGAPIRTEVGAEYHLRGC